MDTAWVLLKCLPFFAPIGYGVYCLLEVFFPSLRDQDFNRWEIDDNSGSYVQVLGWRKMIRPPRVIAQGYLSDRTASTVAFCTGIALIVIGLFAVHRIAGVP